MTELLPKIFEIKISNFQNLQIFESVENNTILAGQVKIRHKTFFRKGLS